MGGQHGSQCGDGVGVVTGPLQLGELVPHRADHRTSGGVGVPSQPRHGPVRQLVRAS